MKWIPDPSGAFPKRLYFDTMQELDDECERLVNLVYYRKFNRDFEPPLDDDTLQVLVEEAADLDLYAPLPPNIDGLTDFRPGQRPLVKVNASFASNAQRHNRFRTTIAHEWFHAVYHRPAMEIRWARARARGLPEESSAGCHSDKITGAPEADWTEFQAGYASCAILMPKSWILRQVEPTVLSAPLDPQVVVEQVAKTFVVSHDAAQWRVTHLGVMARLRAQRQRTIWDLLK